ncbi:MAG: hypothetical protein JOZ52_12020 [Acidobacteria bacterium]|nr:hypothetical protein [Acidobacteriota bacterium]
MKFLLLLPLLLTLVVPAQTGAPTVDGSSLVVLNSKWSKSRQTIVNPDNSRAEPTKSALLPANRNFERNRRVNDQAGVRDPNADTLDGRSAALEKSVQDARAPKATPVDGFAYQVKLRNAGAKAIEIVFWEYRFQEIANPANIVRRQFLCGVNIKPNKEQEINAFSVSGPSDMISLNSLGNKSGKLFDEQIVVNRVEFADGTIWQRKDWNVAEVKAAISRILASPWGKEMCRGF